jgi:hypothetical protein
MAAVLVAGFAYLAVDPFRSDDRFKGEPADAYDTGYGLCRQVDAGGLAEALEIESTDPDDVARHWAAGRSWGDAGIEEAAREGCFDGLSRHEPDRIPGGWGRAYLPEWSASRGHNGQCVPMKVRHLSPLAAILVAFAAVGCADNDSAEEPVPAEPSGPSTPRGSAAEAGSESDGDDYCDAIVSVVQIPVEQVRSDRAAYRDGIAAVAALSPAEHMGAWDALLAFVDDDTSERLNVAADALGEVGSDVLDRCSVNLVLEDWDVLRDYPFDVP